MQPLASAWRAVLRAQDSRTRREIEAEIDAELEFHLAEAERELVTQGVEQVQARVSARAAHGRAACRRAQMGGRIVLVRIQWVVIVLLVAAVAVTFVRASALQAESREREQLARATALAAEAELRKVMSLYETVEVMRTRARDAGQSDARFRVDHETDKIEISLPRVSEVMAAELAGKVTLRSCLEDPDSWRHGLDAIERLVRDHEPRIAADAVTAIYAKLPLEQRQQVFKPFVFDGGHPYAPAVLKLGALDPEPSVRERAWLYLRSYAFADFSEDPAAGEAWLERYADKPLDVALAASAAAMAERVAAKDGAELDRELRVLSEIDPQIARKAGVELVEVFGRARWLESVEGWLGSGDPERSVLALRAVARIGLDRDGFEKVHDLLQGDHAPAEVWDAFNLAVGQRGASWAIPWIVRSAERFLREGRDGASHVAPMALAEIGDPAAIPQLLGLLALDDSHEQRYAIGYYGLRQLTGVAYDESHGIEWWRAWWTENAHRFPVSAEIPDFSRSSFDEK
jgi:hypothetical protein